MSNLFLIDVLRKNISWQATQLAFWLAAGGILISLVAAFALPAKAKAASK